MEFDVIIYESVIRDVLASLRINKNEHEDLTQECYLVLWSRQDKLTEMAHKGTDRSYASMICRNWIRDLQRKQAQYHPNNKTNPTLKFESLSDPKIFHKAMKIMDPADPSKVTDEQLQEAMMSLPYDEYSVLCNLFLEGRTQEQTVNDLGISRWQVRARMERGIIGLKKHFGVDISGE